MTRVPSVHRAIPCRIVYLAVGGGTFCSPGTIWKNVPVCLTRAGNRTGSWGVIWLTGSDGITRFRGVTGRGGYDSPSNTVESIIRKPMGNIVGSMIIFRPLRFRRLLRMYIVYFYPLVFILLRMGKNTAHALIFQRIRCMP